MRAIHILAVLLLLAAGAAAGAEKKACHGGDEAALLAVKAAFSNTSSFMSWTPDIPCCHWPGIDCSDDDGSGGTTGRVVSLAILRDDGITGVVPGDAIAGLTRLQILFLFKLPRVSGAIPAALARLSGLKELTISRTGVSGPVPSFLGALKALESLDLSFNALTGAIPVSLGAPPRLISVDLSRNRLTGRIPPLLLSKAGPQAFLSLSHNNLSGGIPAEFAAVNFEQIDLSRNQLTGDASLLFGRGDDDKPVLDSADLSRNALSFNMSGLRLTRRLDSLDLSHNMIYGGIPAVVANLTNLQVFNVSYNRLCGAVPVGAAASLAGMGTNVAATALFFLLLVSSGFGKKHTPCEGPSQTFKGNCDSAECNASCITEEYKGGYCDVGGIVDCMCTNFCHDGQPPKKFDLTEAKVD